MRVELADMNSSLMVKRVDMIVAAVMAGRLAVCSATRRATRRGLSFWEG